MVRTKQVRFLSVAEHDRIRGRLVDSLTQSRTENAILRVALEFLRQQIDEMRDGVREMMRTAARIREFRGFLRRNPSYVMAACSGEGCRRIMYRPWDQIGGRFRRCSVCRAGDVRSFVDARNELFRASPIEILATPPQEDTDADPTVSNSPASTQSI